MALGAMCLAIIQAPAETSALSVTAASITSFNNFTSGTSFGAFTWRGGLSLSSDSSRFGGLSGLVLDANCEDLLANSDEGDWLSAKLTYNDGRLSGLESPRMQPIFDSKGRPQRNKSWADAEAITRLNSGRIGVAFEHKVRFGSYDVGANGLAAPFDVIRHPPAIDSGPENGEVESFGQLPSGHYVAIAERARDAKGNIPAWIWKGNKITSFSLARYGKYNVTDLAVLPDGSVLTLERRFTRTSLPGMLIRRFKSAGIGNGSLLKPDLLLEAKVPLFVIDNMEGIAVCDRDGETRVTLVSDNNFNTTLQSTLLLQFAFTPDRPSP